MSTFSAPSSYTEGARRGLADDTLQKNLQHLQNHYGRGAFEQWSGLDDQDLRDRVKRRRMETLDNLDVVLSVLIDNVRKKGGQVYCARTAEEAASYCLEVARKHGVKQVVKGKSMVSAEIGVDALLQDAGIEVVETDLGEYIVQLRQEPPSHILGPSVHLNRQQVGRLFADKLGIDYSDDPPTLTKAARNALRQKLLHADMGITGCNVACAETGEISLVSNEGNIRMATTMPRIHVGLMGLERVAATMEDHRDMLNLLTRAGALQKISTYISFNGGPSPIGDPDGPEEFHLIVIDNGRSKILADTEFREVLACIRCGACLNVCPVYGRIGGHAYNAIYSGPIGSVLTPLLYGINLHADLCKGESLCGACLDVCPVKNDLPRMLLALRNKLAYGDPDWQTKPHKPGEAMAFKFWRLLVTNGALYRLALATFSIVQRPFIGKNGMIAKLFGPAAAWTKDRDLPPLAKQSFRSRWQRRKTTLPLKKGDEDDNG
ncbi:MAG: iron-sulfur cluster-binding protein [Deltaproteobacteria bacterium]|nr:iron-sulfur cluster-binding protein [Deltaproteobacteria bacterium]